MQSHHVAMVLLVQGVIGEQALVQGQRAARIACLLLLGGQRQRGAAPALRQALALLRRPVVEAGRVGDLEAIEQGADIARQRLGRPADAARSASNSVVSTPMPGASCS
jgi:hypothetical protein